MERSSDYFRETDERIEWLAKIEERFAKAVSPTCFAANILHPAYFGQRLTPCEIKSCLMGRERNYLDKKSGYMSLIESNGQELQ